MRVIADFHLHSKYARATSKQMVPEEIAKWAKIKGLDVVGSGDSTHPLWINELRQKLEPAEDGLYILKDFEGSPRFMLTGEAACMFRQKNKKGRRVHVHFWLPSFAAAEKMNKELNKFGKIASDGRPIFGLSAENLAEIIFTADPKAVVIPAHIWTPWFGALGSKSGFDSIEECFGKYTSKIFVVETGLSSDPPMNWQVKSLDRFALISNSDAHSGPNLMREANVFELKELSYAAIVQAIKSKDPQRFKYTVEYYPEEGMYHWDGNRKKGISMAPEETHKLITRKSAVLKSLTIGVLHRVSDLADRAEGEKSPQAIPYVNLVPLMQIIAEAMGVGRGSKAVARQYFKIVEACGSEFAALHDKTPEELTECAGERVAEGIINVREGRVHIKPGYDGVYGEVKVFGVEQKRTLGARQRRLF